jgi:hypothetical protein
MTSKRVLDFVGTALEISGYYDNVAHWVEQTYKAVRKQGSASTAITAPTTPNKPVWARLVCLLNWVSPFSSLRVSCDMW